MSNVCAVSGCGGELVIAEATWNESVSKSHALHACHVSHTLKHTIPVLALPVYVFTGVRVLYEKLLATHRRCKRCGKLEGTPH